VRGPEAIPGQFVVPKAGGHPERVAWG